MAIITQESKVEVLGLSENTANRLKEAGIVYVCDLLQMAGAELRVHCDGQEMDEIKNVLARAGLRVGEGLGD